MKIKHVEFWWEGLAKISKQTVLKMITKHIETHPEEDMTLEEYVEILCEYGSLDVGDGIISIVTEIFGFPLEDWENIQ